jgi:hypothetical protein
VGVLEFRHREVFGLAHELAPQVSRQEGAQRDVARRVLQGRAPSSDDRTLAKPLYEFV